MLRRVTLVLRMKCFHIAEITLALLLLHACKSEEPTVDVPFTEFVARTPSKTSTESAEPVLSSTAPTAEARSPEGSNGWTTAPSTPRTAGIDACCASLLLAKQSAKSDASRISWGAAASSCETQRQQLAAAKVTRGQALNAVRLSLLGPAPGACQ